MPARAFPPGSWLWPYSSWAQAWPGLRPLLLILDSVNPHDAGSASDVANAPQQTRGALGIAVVGEVFFSQLATSASYSRAFTASTVCSEQRSLGSSPRPISAPSHEGKDCNR
jgi:hypothetical protein